MIWASAVAALLLVMFAGALPAQRQPVLKQIDLPHPYYYREMYLPQLTTGPSAVCWLPDSREVVYSMAGSLWRQRLDSGAAEEITAGPGYAYQPDCSPDGHWIVYVNYDGQALGLRLLDLATRKSAALTSNGAVNVEPRWSPDGRRIAFVSTEYNRRFHIFIGEVREGKLTSVERLTGETRSTLPRYYYSPFDTEISPAWSPDGKELLFVSNRGHIYGSGSFWRAEARPGAEPREIHFEETTWKARPDFSPDGKRIIFSSYAGRQWHQLWVILSVGGDAFPISYGEYDNTNPRWSPDGGRIAFISNRNGNTELWIQSATGGAQSRLLAAERRYLHAMRELRIAVVGPDGKLIPARLSVTDADGRAYAPDDSWLSADDGIDRTQRQFEAHYFHTDGRTILRVPPGNLTIEVMKGLSFAVERRSITEGQGAQSIQIKLQPLVLPDDSGKEWVSGDLHVHMNYGGAYHNTPKHLIAQARAENLGVVQSLIVNKEQRFPDQPNFTGRLDLASTDETLLWQGQEFHTSYWGHLGLLRLTHNLLLPGYAGYPGTAASSLVPTNADIADLAHAQGGLVGYVHPFEEVPDPSQAGTPVHNALPVDVALGRVDYIEVVGFSDHKSTAAVWYRLLNLGFRVPTGAGTDAMANFASLRGPVGMNRVFVQVPAGGLKMESWLDGLQRGRTFATNGPLLRFHLGGESIGGEVKLTEAKDVPFTAALASIVPVDHLEIVCNGQMVRALELDKDRTSAQVSGTLSISRSGWCVLRAWAESAEHPVLDIYPYATTSPIYVTVAGAPPRSPEDAAYFLAWVDRVVEDVKQYPDWNTDAERAAVLKMLANARAVYERLQR